MKRHEFPIPGLVASNPSGENDLKIRKIIASAMACISLVASAIAAICASPDHTQTPSDLAIKNAPLATPDQILETPTPRPARPIGREEAEPRQHEREVSGGFSRFPPSPRPYVKIPLRSTRSGYLCLPVGIDGRVFLLVVDTGSPATHLDFDRAKRSGVAIPKAKEMINPNRYGYYQTIKTIELGGFSMADVRLSHHDMTAVNRVVVPRYKEEPFDGILGSDILRRYFAVIDVANGELFLSKPTHDDAGAIGSTR